MIAERGLFTFPKDNDRRDVWLKNLAMTNSIGLICYQHFNTCHISKTCGTKYSYKLVRGAVPEKHFNETSHQSVEFGPSTFISANSFDISSEQSHKKFREKRKAEKLTKNHEYKAKIKEKNTEFNNQKIPFNVNEKHVSNVHEVNYFLYFVGIHKKRHQSGEEGLAKIDVCRRGEWCQTQKDVYDFLSELV